MTTNHIDQLREWWETAEQGPPKPGDTIIINLGGGYAVETASECWAGGEWHDDTRILARAPIPKPVWHDAVAVIARCSNAPEGHREPFIRSEATRDVWAGEAGHARTEDLRDVTPLIEAKVTDEMIVRAANAWTGNGYQATRDLSRDLREDITHALTAALGLETE